MNLSGKHYKKFQKFVEELTAENNITDITLIDDFKTAALVEVNWHLGKKAGFKQARKLVKKLIKSYVRENTEEVILFETSTTELISELQLFSTRIKDPSSLRIPFEVDSQKEIMFMMRAYNSGMMDLRNKYFEDEIINQDKVWNILEEFLTNLDTKLQDTEILKSTIESIQSSLYLDIRETVLNNLSKEKIEL